VTELTITTDDGTDDDVRPLVLVDKSDGIATITLNDPDRLNPLGRAMRVAVGSALAEADVDPTIRCIVLTGAGRAFSAGGDHSQGEPFEGVQDWYWLVFKSFDGLAPSDPTNFLAPIDPHKLRTPVVAAINGFCAGSALMAASECDILIAGESAGFAMIESRMAHGGAGTMPYFIGPQWTRFLMYTGETITAQKAKEIGLVLEVVPDDELQARARDLASRIAAMPGQVVDLNKQQINGTLEMTGWAANKAFSSALGAVIETSAKDATLRDGRNLYEIFQTEGWKAWKQARDAAHPGPWLAHDEER